MKKKSKKRKNTKIVFQATGVVGLFIWVILSAILIYAVLNVVAPSVGLTLDLTNFTNVLIFVVLMLAVVLLAAVVIGLTMSLLSKLNG